MSSFGRQARALAAFAVVVAVAMLDASSSSATDATPNGDPPITTFSDPGHHLRRPRDIVAGPDGNLWFTADSASTICRLTTHGVMTEYPVHVPATTPAGIAAGPDGYLWFTDRNSGNVGSISSGVAHPGRRPPPQRPHHG